MAGVESVLESVEAASVEALVEALAQVWALAVWQSLATCKLEPSHGAQNP